MKTFAQRSELKMLLYKFFQNLCAQVGHSLLTLRISHGLSTSISEIPSRSFKSLTNLQHLDLSNNKIRSLPATSFHFLKRIKRIELQDNEIDNIPKGTFQVSYPLLCDTSKCPTFHPLYAIKKSFIGRHPFDVGRGELCVQSSKKSAHSHVRRFVSSNDDQSGRQRY